MLTDEPLNCSSSTSFQVGPEHPVEEVVGAVVVVVGAVVVVVGAVVVVVGAVVDDVVVGSVVVVVGAVVVGAVVVGAVVVVRRVVLVVGAVVVARDVVVRRLVVVVARLVPVVDAVVGRDVVVDPVVVVRSPGPVVGPAVDSVVGPLDELGASEEVEASVVVGSSGSAAGAIPPAIADEELDES